MKSKYFSWSLPAYQLHLHGLSEGIHPHRFELGDCNE
jgi:hypothetical protein